MVQDFQVYRQPVLFSGNPQWSNFQLIELKFLTFDSSNSFYGIEITALIKDISLGYLLISSEGSDRLGYTTIGFVKFLFSAYQNESCGLVSSG